MMTLFHRLKFHVLGFFAGLLIFLIAATMSNLYGEAGFLVFIFVVIAALSPTIIQKYIRDSRLSINEIIERDMNEKKHRHDPEELMLAVSCALGMASAMCIVNLVMR